MPDDPHRMAPGPRKTAAKHAAGRNQPRYSHQMGVSCLPVDPSSPPMLRRVARMQEMHVRDDEWCVLHA